MPVVVKDKFRMGMAPFYLLSTLTMFFCSVNISGNIPSILGFLFSCAAFVWCQIEKRGKISVDKHCLSVVFLFLILSVFFLLKDSDSNLNDYLRVNISLLSSFFIVIVLTDQGKFFCIRILQLLIVIHVVSLVIQIFYFISFSDYLDLFEIIADSDYSSRFKSSIAESFLGLRVTGWYAEPSMLSMTLTAIAVIYLIVNGWKKDLFFYIAIISSILTLSSAATFINIAIVVMLYVYDFFSGKRKLKFYHVVAFIVFIFCGLWFAQMAFDRIQMAEDYNLISSRLLVFKHFTTQSTVAHFFGNGLFLDGNVPYGEYGLFGYNYKDTGFFVYSYFSIGLIATLLFFFCIFYFVGINGFIILLLLLCYKFTYYHNVFWIVIFFFIIWGGVRNGQESE